MPRVGLPAPDFSLPDQHGTPVTLSGIRGRPVLMVFFPWAFSAVCGGELRTLRDSGISDAAIGDSVVVLGISVDSVFAQRTFSDSEGVEFPLLSDAWPHGEVADRYGVLDSERGVALRASFLLDPAGLLTWCVVNGLGQPRDVEDYRAAIRRLAV